MNHIMVAGRLGADPEVRFTSSGQKVTAFRLASNLRRSGKEETIWWRITVWGDQFDKLMTYLKKGSAVIVFGEFGKPEIYTDREGQPQISLNITASSINFSPFGGRSQQEEAGAVGQSAEPHSFGQNQPKPSFETPVAGQGEKAPAFADDEIPF